MSTVDFFKIGARFGFCSMQFLHVKAQGRNYPEEPAIQFRLDAFRFSVSTEIITDLIAISAALKELEDDINRLYFRDDD